MAAVEIPCRPNVRIAQIGHRHVEMPIGIQKTVETPQGAQRIAHVLDGVVAGDEIEFFLAEIDIGQARVAAYGQRRIA